MPGDFFALTMKLTKGIIDWMTTVIVLYVIEMVCLAIGLSATFMAWLILIVAVLFVIFMLGGQFNVERWNGTPHYEKISSGPTVSSSVLPRARWVALSAIAIQTIVLLGVTGDVLSVLGGIVLLVDIAVCIRIYKGDFNGKA